MRVDIVTIFPEYFGPLELSLIGKARAAGLLDLSVHDLRTWTSDVHRTVDDTPYGGGPGMVMRPEPWAKALDALLQPAPGPADGAENPSKAPPPPAPGPADGAENPSQPREMLVVPSPVGKPFTQADAYELAGSDHLIFACGRYEGIDQRVIDEAAARMPVREVSLGDYVLFGGEVAVIVIMEAVTRLLPGVLGNAESLAEESYADGLLEAPVYTKPATWRDRAVPDVLRSGDHGRIARWRREQSLLRTAARRPDLLAGYPRARLDKRDRAALVEAGFQIDDPDVAE